jgi:hypothetical protein
MFAFFSSILGWTALLVIGSGSLFWISAQGPGHTERDFYTAGLIIFAGVIMGIIWLQTRRRVRAMNYQTRMLRRRLGRIGD